MTVFFPSLQQLEHDAVLTLFRMTNFNRRNLAETAYFTAGVGVVMGGVQYTPVNCELSGEEMSSEGSLARPKLRVDDTTKGISNLVYYYDGLEGARLAVYRTLKRYLDSETTADPAALRLDGLYVISQRIQEIPGKMLEFELSAPIDFVDESVPGRPCGTKCPWVYRSAECSYVGTTYFTLDNKRTLDPSLDDCSKSVTACTRRFGKNSVLPFGGFPGLRRF
jgi:lambda family phage minor tail protein L